MTNQQRAVAYKDWEEVYRLEIYDKVRHWGTLSLRFWPVALKWPELDQDVVTPAV